MLAPKMIPTTSGLGVRARTAAAAASASYQYRTLLAIAAAAAAFGVEASTPQRPLSPRVNVTVYHVASANYTGISNMNTGDANGDADFMLRAAGLPWLCSAKSGLANVTYDCQDGEQTAGDLVVTKVLVEASSRWAEYSECNVAAGVYSCECRNQSAPHRHHTAHATVPCAAAMGRIKVVNESGWAHELPDPTDPDPFMRSAYRYYFYNAAQKFQGLWFSTLEYGRCGRPGTLQANCTWRVAERVKRISKSCLEQRIYAHVQQRGAACFATCAQPLQIATKCWTDCFYDTVLGPGSNATAYSAGSHAGISAQDIIKVWDSAFVSGDSAKGGCPPV